MLERKFLWRINLIGNVLFYELYKVDLLFKVID